jgi:NAD-dependent SIR2 family protein deacetylase
MEKQLLFTANSLFSLILEATLTLHHRDREKVLQTLYDKLIEEHDVLKKEMRALMDEHGITIREYCSECNESIYDWDFEEKGDSPLCEVCEKEHPWIRPCEVCTKPVKASIMRPFTEDSVVLCSSHRTTDLLRTGT